MTERSYAEILNERAGTMAAVEIPAWQKQLAMNGSGESSNHSSKTITVNAPADAVKEIALVPRIMKPNVAGVVHFWNGQEYRLETADGKVQQMRTQIVPPGFLTTCIVFKDHQRTEISNFRDMAATAPIRRIIVNAIRTIRTSADKMEAHVNSGDVGTLQTLCQALRESVHLIETKAKELA